MEPEAPRCGAAPPFPPVAHPAGGSDRQPPRVRGWGIARRLLLAWVRDRRQSSVGRLPRLCPICGHRGIMIGGGWRRLRKSPSACCRRSGCMWPSGRLKNGRRLYPVDPVRLIRIMPSVPSRCVGRLPAAAAVAHAAGRDAARQPRPATFSRRDAAIFGPAAAGGRGFTRMPPSSAAAASSGGCRSCRCRLIERITTRATPRRSSRSVPPSVPDTTAG